MKPIDPLHLQRLVDGELDNNQVQQILIEAKETPNQWQDIAIGFVENQIWSRAFENLDLSHKVGSAEGASLRAADPRSANTDTGRRPTNYSWLVMAASLFLAATIGYMANQIQNRNLPGPSVAENVPLASSPLLADRSPANSQFDNRATVVQPQMTPADYHLEVPPEHFGELGSAGPIAPVPLFSVNSVEQLRRINKEQNSSGISPEMLEQLAGSGYQMEQDVNYISGRLGDGRSFVVPVRTLRFVPGQ